MFNSIDYLTKKATFKQVNPEFPITQTIPDSEDPKMFNGTADWLNPSLDEANNLICYLTIWFKNPPYVESRLTYSERKQELAEQLLYKAKQIETLISVLPSASDLKSTSTFTDSDLQDGEASKKDEADLQAEDNDKELQELEAEMQVVNAEYMEVLTTAGRSHDAD